VSAARAAIRRLAPCSFLWRRGLEGELAFWENFVHHCADPATVVRNMVALARAVGFVILRHWRNEGQKARYEELHQWNIDIEETW
jgi:hypothetical protein